VTVNDIWNIAHRRCPFEEVVDIEDNCLKVVGRLLEVAGSLQKAGLIVEYGCNQ
jgi:hypothetical protein